MRFLPNEYASNGFLSTEYGFLLTEYGFLSTEYGFLSTDLQGAGVVGGAQLPEAVRPERPEVALSVCDHCVLRPHLHASKPYSVDRKPYSVDRKPYSDDRKPYSIDRKPLPSRSVITVCCAPICSEEGSCLRLVSLNSRIESKKEEEKHPHLRASGEETGCEHTHRL